MVQRVSVFALILWNPIVWPIIVNRSDCYLTRQCCVLEKQMLATTHNSTTKLTMKPCQKHIHKPLATVRISFSVHCKITAFGDNSHLPLCYRKSPSKLVSVEDNNMEGAGFLLKQSVWDAARSTIEEWTGQRLAECSLYGIRVYEEGAILATHVDRLPLVSVAWTCDGI